MNKLERRKRCRMKRAKKNLPRVRNFLLEKKQKNKRNKVRKIKKKN